jgi:cytochrome b
MTENNSTPNEIKVFDIPTRMFHWAFAISIVMAFSIGKFADDESPIYPFHMFFGAMAITAVFFRIVWGIIGTKYARFSAFNLNPFALPAYLKSAFDKNAPASAKRNPASSIAAIAMMIFGIMIPLSGYNMLTATTREQGHQFHEIHETLATLIILIALVHIAGVVVYKMVKGENIGMAMFNGNKKAAAGETGITNIAPVAGVLLLTLLGGSAFALASNYNAQNGTVNVLGKTLQVAENEDGEKGEKGEEARERGEKGESEAEEREEHENNALSSNAVVIDTLAGPVTLDSKTTKAYKEKEDEESEEHERNEKKQK